GELHRRQVDLHERIAERIPHHAPLPDASDPAGDPVSLADLAAEQEKLTLELEAISRQLQDYGEQRPDSARARRAVEAAAAAVGDSRLALEALRRDSAATVHATQAGAVASLEELLAANKNHHLAAIF